MDHDGLDVYLKEAYISDQRYTPDPTQEFRKLEVLKCLSRSCNVN